MTDCNGLHVTSMVSSSNHVIFVRKYVSTYGVLKVSASVGLAMINFTSTLRQSIVTKHMYFHINQGKDNLTIRIMQSDRAVFYATNMFVYRLNEEANRTFCVQRGYRHLLAQL